MNTDCAVYVSNLTKVYRFYKKPAHRLFEAVLRHPMHTAFSALEEVSFSVDTGGTLGIIGENGAGKSTLLKILARTLNPSGGHIQINGKVAALLELGAGFHQEFTGRQNIFLNASLLGLADADIRDKEEEIIDFSELGDFIDRPLKSYSSGMVVRLAFSIATCVDPDILIVDEALSVGDVRFQQKCIKRMARFRQDGKTLIFCSHSMYHVNELCAQSLWLNQGRVRSMGETSRVVSEFMNHLDGKNTDTGEAASEDCSASELAEAVVTGVRVTGMEGKEQAEFRPGKDDLIIRIETQTKSKGFTGHLGAAIFNPEDQMVFGTSTKYLELPPVNFSGEQAFSVRLKAVPLKRGSFKIRAYILDQEGLRIVDELTTRPYKFASGRPDLGFLWIDCEWIIG